MEAAKRVYRPAYAGQGIHLDSKTGISIWTNHIRSFSGFQDPATRLARLKARSSQHTIKFVFYKGHGMVSSFRTHLANTRAETGDW